METPKIAALAPWFGSKRTLAPEIVKELGDHRVYWEPLCGSMAVLLSKPPCVMETVNDLHGHLINLAHVLKDEETAIALYSRLARVVFHEDLFREAADRIKASGHPSHLDDVYPDLARAEDFMITSWFGRNGVVGSRNYNINFCVRYTANGGHAAKRWNSVLESMPEWHLRLRNVTILNRDAFEVLARISDEPRTAIYCDPPYLAKGAKYIHDFEREDHFRFSEALCRFRKARVVLSYYDHPLLPELHPGWRVRHLQMSKSLANQG